MSQESDIEDVRRVIKLYTNGTYEGSVDKLKQAFHPEAMMCGYFQGQRLMGGVDPFYASVEASPAPKEQGQSYEPNVTAVRVAGNAATATLEERPYMGLNFTNFFHLLKTDGQWQIVSKTFAHE